MKLVPDLTRCIFMFYGLLHGATTAEKLYGTSCGLDADPLPLPSIPPVFFSLLLPRFPIPSMLCSPVPKNPTKRSVSAISFARSPAAHDILCVAGLHSGIHGRLCTSAVCH